MNTIDMMYSKSDTFSREMIISMISHSDFRSEEILYTIMNFENHIDRILSIYVYKVHQFEKYFNTYFLKKYFLYSSLYTWFTSSR